MTLPDPIWGCRWLRRLFGIAFLLFSIPVAASAQDQNHPVLAMERDLALVLTRDGFDAFVALFHEDFTLWIDGQHVTRDEYLAGVADWSAAGNGAVATELRPVSLDVFEDFALSRYVLREDFVGGTSFVGRFVSLARRNAGGWQVYRTTVFTIYRGPSATAPAIEEAS